MVLVFYDTEQDCAVLRVYVAHQYFPAIWSVSLKVR